VKPFLFLATRSDDEPADAEYEAFLKRTGLDESTLVRLRLESQSLPQIDLDDWSGILVGGSPFNASTPPEKKSATQKRVEAELSGLLDRGVDDRHVRAHRDDRHRSRSGPPRLPGHGECHCDRAVAISSSAGRPHAIAMTKS